MSRLNTCLMFAFDLDTHPFAARSGAPGGCGFVPDCWRPAIRSVLTACMSLNDIRRAAELDQERIDEALQVGMSVRRPGFDIVFDTVQTFAGNSRSKTGGRSNVLTVLSRGAREALALYGDICSMDVGPPSFTPHLTLWHGPERVPDLPFKRPFRWPVPQFWPVHTIAGQNGPNISRNGPWAAESGRPDLSFRGAFAIPRQRAKRAPNSSTDL